MEKIIQRFKAMGDENRFRILMLLLERPLCVCELLEVLDIKGGTLSAHLKILKNAGLINHEKDGRWIIYSISTDDNIIFLKQIEQELEDNNTIQNDKIKIGKISRGICSTHS